MLTQTGELSPRRELGRRLAVLTTATAIGLATVTAPVRSAHADSANPAPGTVGGAFVGAEVVTIGMSLFGVRSGWAYLVGGVLGAGGGAAGGYALEQGTTDGKPGTYLLAGGFALMIPALVLSPGGGDVGRSRADEPAAGRSGPRREQRRGSPAPGGSAPDGDPSLELDARASEPGAGAARVPCGRVHGRPAARRTRPGDPACVYNEAAPRVRGGAGHRVPAAGGQGRVLTTGSSGAGAPWRAGGRGDAGS